MAGRRRRGGMVIILLALIIIFGLVAGVVLFRDQLFGGGDNVAGEEQPVFTPTAPQPMVQIIVLVQPVKRGGMITEDLTRLVFYPESERLEGLFITEMEEVEGKKAKYDLAAGIPLTNNLLYDSDEGSLLSYGIPKGMVAISLPISRLTSVSYTLQPGDHVGIITSLLFIDYDPKYQTPLPNAIIPLLAQGPTNPETGESQLLYLTLQGGTDINTNSALGHIETLEGVEDGFPIFVVPSEPQQHGRMVSQMIVQDAMVLYVGEFPIEDEETEEEEDADMGQPTPTPIPAEGETPPPVIKPDLITLVVSPQDALTLNYLMLNNGKINLVMRSAGDQSQLLFETVTMQFILEQYNIPVPSNLETGLGIPYNYDTQTYDFEYQDTSEDQPFIIPPQ
jgi:Flp pilus assembly protein CpaB